MTLHPEAEKKPNYKLLFQTGLRYALWPVAPLLRLLFPRSAGEEEAARNVERLMTKLGRDVFEVEYDLLGRPTSAKFIKDERTEKM